jgi:hypothetical protein
LNGEPPPLNGTLRWKRRAKANSLAYCNTSKITAVKSLIVKAPGACTTKLFKAVI